MTDQEIATKLLEFYGGDEKKWTRSALARDLSGFPVVPTASDACAWCLAGAAFAIWDGVTSSFADFEKRHFNDLLPVWNDAPGRTFADVEAKLKEIAGS